VERTTIAGETEELGENLPQRQFVPPQISHDQARFRTPDRSGGKPATNRLSYGAALCSVVTRIPDDGNYTDLRITGFLDFVHRPVFYRLENNVSETGSVSIHR
jgi:hypothetical protein